MTDFTYVIERFDVSSEKEELIERAELVRESDALVCLAQGHGERTFEATDVPSATAIAPNAVVAGRYFRTGEANFEAGNLFWPLAVTTWLVPWAGSG